VRPLRIRRSRGFSLIELMVGVVIGLLAILIIYQLFSVSENFKRNTTSVGDAQQNGFLSTFMLGTQLANAGNVLALTGIDLQTCADPGSANPIDDFAATWRPVPVLIIDSNVDTTPDVFAVNYSIAQRLVNDAPFQQPAAAGAPYQVQSPTGFKSGDLVVAISQAGPCVASQVTAVTAPDANGVVTVTHSAPGYPVDSAMSASALLLNMGPANDVQKVRYDLVLSSDGTTPCDDTLKQNCILRATPLIDQNGKNLAAGERVPNPLASNVVNMKLQYGVDTNNDGVLEWVKAENTWSPQAVLQMPQIPPGGGAPGLSMIKAVRIGIVVRGEQFDQNYNQDVQLQLFGGAANGGYDMTYAKVLPQGNWRYRVYETIVPLRNEIWNKS